MGVDFEDKVENEEYLIEIGQGIHRNQYFTGREIKNDPEFMYEMWLEGEFEVSDDIDQESLYRLSILFSDLRSEVRPLVDLVRDELIGYMPDDLYSDAGREYVYPEDFLFSTYFGVLFKKEDNRVTYKIYSKI